MKLSDFKGLFKKSILTVLSVENPFGDYYQIKLKPDSGVSWIPGEHGIFKLPNNNVTGKKYRAFSVASIPEEGMILIGTRTGKEISSFKKELISMKEGEKVSLRGPFGWFKIKDSESPIVMIAGGVGITPIRALVTKLQNDDNRAIEVLYASSEYYLFDEHIQKVALNNKNISIHKTAEVSDTNLILTDLVNKYHNNAFYFISGSRPFINAIKKQIKESGVSSKRIINDPFFGY